MRIRLLIIAVLILFLAPVLGLYFASGPIKAGQTLSPQKSHWLLLHRKSGIEYLYYGILGEANHSQLIKTFQVRPGAAGSSPTPLPSLLGRDYWLIVKKESSIDNPETAPYFLQLDVLVTSDWPYGPVPYEECGGQCDWVIPGYFGLHGVGGNTLKLSRDDPGSSGCIRHSDSDITYLYNILNPQSEEIRYYIEDI